MCAEPIVRTEGLSHRFGAKTALIDATLELPAGSTTAVVGPDGVGKSTLLSLISGTRKIQTGTVTVLGGDMRDARHRGRVAPRIAYMLQGLGKNLYPTLSVVENIDFFGRLHGQGPRERAARIQRLLEATGLKPFSDRAAGKLSGGMKQKLSLCCALVHDPDLLILDEPTTGVDPLSRRQFWALIDALRAERPAMTVVVATAYMEEAARFERLIAIDEGRILAAERTADVLARTGASTLEAAYVALQRPERRGQGGALVIPPRAEHDGAPAIEAFHLTRRFGDFVAVDDVSFRIGRGEIFGFLGSNGCGKTTTMKMLTGLLPVSEGRAELLGKPVDAGDIATRMRVGYMSQSFSLYDELSVRANLELHAKLYRVPKDETRARVTDALTRFDLADVASELPAGLPLGIRQRLQLAAACLHRPEVLILDEPTSGVDPAARDLFWRLMIELARRDGVTIFVSTHFMNEAERCDRISLMHAGKVLAVGTPAELVASKGSPSLEEAFIAYLTLAAGESVEAAAAGAAADPPPADPEPAPGARSQLAVSLGRIWAFARREGVELLRDRVRLAFGLIGPLILMLTFGYGISFDVEKLSFAVLDRDQSIESRTFLEAFAGSRYFSERPPLNYQDEIDARMRAGELRLAITIPPSFGHDLLSNQRPEVGFWLDGANAFRAETTRGYVNGVVQAYAEDLARRTYGAVPDLTAVELRPRFRYNQDFRSVFAIAPGIIMMLMAMIPAMMTALGVVREREIGSIANLYASPATVGEFLIGKQLPYLALGFVSFLLLIVLVVVHFGVPVRGSLLALVAGGALYIAATTAFGLFVSSFVKSQVAAMMVTAVLCNTIAINFSGLLYPTSTLTGSAKLLSVGFPASWFQHISLGTFTKGLPASAFTLDLVVLVLFAIGFLMAARLFLKKQET
ncbi:ribosome-associated ATPase/putative transporter RbbA [Blastochloris viridis]|uniref:ABC-type multidrug transport system n=1 Tax=Blastochloris viridis TaxID=1079 RepID=A0A0H5B9S5_BLAVI|nr:ribosome-associated ATPase/putative transporter RbbA [Blastochloris viridis]ALK08903.1 putative ABC transporter ATP-binding protein YbhF [Blastochloris viridis]BAR97794.1 ABC-type multidrug transport system [Blastochloris viridis]CUU41564.1 putative ABC transporter ATP-binding protein YbhF [Blastochloris viridis]